MAERRRLGVQDALWLEMDRPTNLMVVDTVVWTETPDRELVPDHEQIVDGFEAEFRRLEIAER